MPRLQREKRIFSALFMSSVCILAVLILCSLISIIPVSQSMINCSSTSYDAEGPFFSEDAPNRISFIENGTDGTLLFIYGKVISTYCVPMDGMYLDFWQTDADGNYDNDGYEMRGGMYVNENGEYNLTTVIPGIYSNRPRHIHVKLSLNGVHHLTTQLYFDDYSGTNIDLQMELLEVRNSSLNSNNDSVFVASFDFVLNSSLVINSSLLNSTSAVYSSSVFNSSVLNSTSTVNSSSVLNSSALNSTSAVYSSSALDSTAYELYSSSELLSTLSSSTVTDEFNMNISLTDTDSSDSSDTNEKSDGLSKMETKEITVSLIGLALYLCTLL